MATRRHEQHALEFHQGEALWTLARTYSTLRLCLVEAVQNGIDADATAIYVGVDLIENRVAVCDNGSGVSEQKFQQALRSVGKGIKTAGALGRFGRGLIAPVHLARTMTFMSRPKDASGVHSWLFIGESLRRQSSDLKIPYQLIGDFPKLPDPFTHAHNEAKAERRGRGVEWRTMLLLDKVTSDRMITDIDPHELEDLIRTKLGHGMRQKGTTVYLKVQSRDGVITQRKIDPASYDGHKLKEITYKAPDAGEVTFELYRARMQGGKRKGHVVVMQTGDNYPVTIQELRTQALGSRMYSNKDTQLAEIKEGFDALCSGEFEGVIRVERVELDPERTKFELGDALTDTYFLIADWYDKVGRGLLHDVREAQSETRYRELGAQSIERLARELQDNDAFAHLVHDLRGMLPSPPRRKPETRDKQEPSQEQKPPGDQPSRRIIVRPKQSNDDGTRASRLTFISFAYELLRGSARLWEYDHESGVLTFNIRHPLWAKVDETNGKHTSRHDKQVMQLQEWLTFKLLLLLATHIDPSEIELHRAEIDREVGYYIAMFILRK